MKIIKKVGVLVLLSACLFITERDHVTQAQTSCPARDQCYDAANNTYSDLIAAAQDGYFDCTQNADSTRNTCLSEAEQTKSSCQSEANWEFELNLPRCQVISDQYLYEYCMQELDSARQTRYSLCEYEFDNLVQACWWKSSSDNQDCEAQFYEDEARAASIRDLMNSGCDIIDCN